MWCSNFDSLNRGGGVFARGGGVFICVKNYIACSKLWVDDDFKIIAVEVKGNDPKSCGKS
jgi:hypothetical protein